MNIYRSFPDYTQGRISSSRVDISPAAEREAARATIGKPAPLVSSQLYSLASCRPSCDWVRITLVMSGGVGDAAANLPRRIPHEALSTLPGRLM